MRKPDAIIGTVVMMDPQTLARTIKVQVADDHIMVRDLFVSALRAETDIEIVAEATNGQEVINQLQAREVDLLMLDLSMPPPNGLELISMLRHRYPDLRILVVSMHSNPTVAKVVLDSGAHGYITKDCNPEDLLKALRVVAGGQPYVEKRILESILLRTSPRSIDQLTPRETQVLRCLAAGQTHIEIAREMFLSEKTVSTCEVNLMTKLNLHSISDLVQYAHKHLPDQSL